MTIAQLEALLQEHFPQAAAPATEQGRAGVTSHVERNRRYDNLETVSSALWYYDRNRKCLVCGKQFDRHGSRQKYCSDACKQKAYRQRKRGKRTAA